MEPLTHSQSLIFLLTFECRAHLRFARQLQQRAAEGKTLGHLGNVLCLLGNFSSAHKYMEAVSSIHS